MTDLTVDHKKLRAIAEKERWSNAALAKETGLSREAISKILNGNVRPLAVSLKRICDVIGVPIEEFFLDRSAGIETQPQVQG